MNDLRALDESLEYLNEGKISETIKSLFDKFTKKKNLKKKDKDQKTNSPKYIALDNPVISKARKNFRDKLAKECKSIISKYPGFSVNDSSSDDYYEDFYTINGYFEGRRPTFENDNITLITSDWYDLPAYNKYPKDMTKTEYSETPEITQWYKDQQKIFEDAKKRLSKYGELSVDGSYDDFFIDLYLNKETIASFKDNEVIDKIME